MNINKFCSLFKAFNLIQAYYASTIVFIGLDYLFGINVRVAGLADGSGYKLAYYIFCLVCFCLVIIKPSLSALVGVFESSIDIAMLLISRMQAIYSLPYLVQGNINALVSTEHLINFLLVGAFGVYVFQQQVNQLRK